MALEQYITPPNIVASLLLEVDKLYPFDNLIVGDICCGTGALTIGAYCLGAKVSHYIGNTLWRYR